MPREPPRDSREMYDRNRGPPRDTRARNDLPPRDRGYEMNQGPDPRQRPLGPPESNVPTSNRDASVNSDRTRSQQQPPPHGPPYPPLDRLDRGERPTSDREPPRRYEDDRSDRQTRGARPRSPSTGHPRSDNRGHHEYPDDRHVGYDRTAPDHRDSRREDGPNLAPSGPRSDRPSRYEAAEGNRAPRELFQQPSSQRGPHESSHGRLGHGGFDATSRPPPQDPNYGRLNPMPEAPAGPRGRPGPGRGGRNFTAPQAQGSRPDTSSVNQTPVSPTFERNPAASGTGQDWRDNRSGPRASGPPTPSTEQPPNGSDTTGIHPSRLAQIATVGESYGDGRAAPVNNGPPPPAGPRMGNQGRHGPQMYNQQQSQPVRNAPSGPASTNDRRDTRHLANLNSHLLQADRGGPAPRGRPGTRNPGPSGGPRMPSPPPNLQSPTSTSGPSLGHPTAPQQQFQSGPPSRQDMAPPFDRGGRPPSSYQEQSDYHNDSRSGGPPRRRETRGNRSSRSRSPSRRDRDQEARARDDIPRSSDRPDGRAVQPPPPPPPVDNRSSNDRAGPTVREPSRRSTRGNPRDDREPERERERDREPSRREPRGAVRDSRNGPPDGPPPARGQPPPQAPPFPREDGQNPHWNDARGGPRSGGPQLRNGERGPSGRERDRRDDGRDRTRDDGRRDSGRDSGRDGRKRGRAGPGPDEGAMGPGVENKRPRRGEN
jgi:THO complex subunit 2